MNPTKWLFEGQFHPDYSPGMWNVYMPSKLSKNVKKLEKNLPLPAYEI